MQIYGVLNILLDNYYQENKGIYVRPDPEEDLQINQINTNNRLVGTDRNKQQLGDKLQAMLKQFYLYRSPLG